MSSSLMLCAVPFQGVGQPEAGRAARRLDALHQTLLVEEHTGPRECRGSQHAESESRPHHQGPARTGFPEDVVGVGWEAAGQPRVLSDAQACTLLTVRAWCSSFVVCCF